MKREGVYFLVLAKVSVSSTGVSALAKRDQILLAWGPHSPRWEVSPSAGGRSSAVGWGLYLQDGTRPVSIWEPVPARGSSTSPGRCGRSILGDSEEASVSGVW